MTKLYCCHCKQAQNNVILILLLRNLTKLKGLIIMYRTFFAVIFPVFNGDIMVLIKAVTFLKV